MVLCVVWPSEAVMPKTAVLGNSGIASPTLGIYSFEPLTNKLRAIT